MTPPASSPPTGSSRDPGLANERTLLAGQRTALSLMAAALVMGRLAFEDLGVIGLPGAVGAGALAAWVFVESRWRYRQADGTRARSRARGGRAATFMAIAVILLALTETAVTLRHL